MEFMKKTVLFPLSLVFLCLACGSGRQPGTAAQVREFSSYRDIPGVSPEEIEAIEQLRLSTNFFTYGMTQSTECFRDEAFVTRGFTALVCDWLTDLFGIRFRPVIYEWDSLLRGMESRDIAFSGEISSSLRGADYFMTDSIAERRIRFVSTEGADRLAIMGNSRRLRYGFMKGTTTEALVSPYIRQKYDSVVIANYTETYQKLILKEIDALFMDETVEGIFQSYGNLIIEDFLPLTYNTVSMATRDPKLAPIISVVEKYLHYAGSYRFAQMYEAGNKEYLRHYLTSRLTEEEADYVLAHQSEENAVPVSIESDNYPISFYNETEGEWQGIAVDMIDELEQLTGLDFVYANTPRDEWGTVINMLQEHTASMTTKLIRSAARERDYLLANTPYLIDYYAFISNSSYQDVTLSDIPYKRVGLVQGTAYADIFRELFPGHQGTVEYKNRLDAIAALEKDEIDLLMGTRNLLLSITNYMERAGYKANLVLHRPYESLFGFNREERILCSIVNKAQGLIDTERVVDNWTRRVFDYSGALAKAQKPYFIGLSVALGLILLLLTIILLRNRQMAAQLEATVRQRTHELEIQTGAARVASRAKGEFLARMSHEIRTPLNAVIGMTEIARRSGTLEKKDASLEKIAAASQHLLGILNDVLDMSKIESGKFVIAHEPFMLRAAMEEVENIILQRCEEKRIAFKSDFTGLDGDTGVLGDKLRLKQVLINLLGNAVKFTPDGGRIRFSAVRAEPASPEEGKIRVHFIVSDSGIGIKREQMENLFIAFEQVDSTISPRFGGTGLGLAISQNLIKQMGGLITVESVFREGSTFEFTLDLDIAEGIKRETDRIVKAVQFPGKHILLAEDIAINRMILSELLADTKLVIDEAADGQDVLKIFANSKPGYYSLIFMDVQMPNMDGHEATRRIRLLNRKDAQTIPIIAMTANAYREDIDRALAAGMNDHLAKPVDISEVLKTLDKWLGHD
jgi:signal transduction histidine kinase/CheY-like chemotaxis protein